LKSESVGHPRCHHPRRRMIQYSEAPVMKSKSRSVLDTRLREV
jgi:hypothetical protein